MRIVIIGASGAIGSYVYRYARQAGHEVIATGCSRLPAGYLHLNIEKQSLLDVVPDLGAGDCVVLLSAYATPGWIAHNIDKAKLLNVDASLRVIEETYRAGARTLILSTDQVFDGQGEPFDEESPTNPLNTYGKMKVILEQKILSLGGLGCIARSGWNATWTQEGKCVVKETYEMLLSGQAKMATDNLINVTAADDTAIGLVKLATGSNKSIYHLVSDPPIIRSDLADLIIENSCFNHQMGYETVKFNELSYAEGRPLRPWLTNYRAISELGLLFSTPQKIVERKVPLLDEMHKLRSAK